MNQFKVSFLIWWFASLLQLSALDQVWSCPALLKQIVPPQILTIGWGSVTFGWLGNTHKLMFWKHHKPTTFTFVSVEMSYGLLKLYINIKVFSHCAWSDYETSCDFWDILPSLAISKNLKKCSNHQVLAWKCSCTNRPELAPTGLVHIRTVITPGTVGSMASRFCPWNITVVFAPQSAEQAKQQIADNLNKPMRSDKKALRNSRIMGYNQIQCMLAEKSMKFSINISVRSQAPMNQNFRGILNSHSNILI